MEAQFGIIDNCSASDSHFERLERLARESSEIILVSPFLMEDFSPLKAALGTVDRITLVTTLPPYDFNQIQKVRSFLSFFEAVENEDKLSIRIDNKLHGKVYLFKSREGRFISGIVTSANLTNRGLSQNHEWGVEITDQQILQKLESSVTGFSPCSIVTKEQALRMKKKVNAFLKKHAHKPSAKIDIDLNRFFPEESRTHPTTYWLKPMGVTGDPIKEGEPFDQDPYELYFSKKRPKGLSVDDIVITYAVKFTKILSVYRITSEPVKSSPAMIAASRWKARWPWYVSGRNLTPRYGKTWAQHNLTLKKLQEDFKSAHPKEDLTFVGGKGLGGLNFGLDKIHLSEAFADFIMGKVQDIEDEHIFSTPN